MTPPLTIDLLDPWDRVPAGVWRSLRFVVARPPDQAGAVRLPAGGVRGPTADVEVNTDLFSQDVELRPGDSACLTVGVRIARPGASDLSQFKFQVNPVGGDDTDGFIQHLPAHPFRVLPDLDRALDVGLTRVCAYDDAVKVEVVVRNTGAADLTAVDLALGPRTAVRAGPLRRQLPRLAPDEELRFDLVVLGDDVELSYAATVAGDRVEGRRTLAVPAAGTDGGGTRPPFVFLEPRVLTTDRLALAAEDRGADVPAAGGVFPVCGGRSRYFLTVYPSHPQAKSVRLFTAAGQVEVEPLHRSGRGWPFRLTVVENAMFTQLVRLDYDVDVPGPPLRGEVYLSVRPAAVRHWVFAATAGLAVTIKGAGALGPALLKGDPGFDGLAPHLADLFEHRWSDWLQAASIPAIWVLLWLTDRIWRTVQVG